jgi:hypothetical protein
MLVMKRQGKALRMLEEVAAKVQDHTLIHLCVDIVTDNGQPTIDQCNRESGKNGKDQ